MSIVAISETMGSLGNEIGRRLADSLGWGFADREIIAKAAEIGRASCRERVCSTV